MMIRWVLAAGLMAAVPGFAQAPATRAASEVANWETMAKLYPPRARAAREQGIVHFLVKLDNKGHPTECQVTKSSGFPLLDQETCQLITLHAVFKPVAGVSGSQVSSHQGAIQWKLPAASAAAGTAAPTPVKVAAAPKKTVCRRVPTTGSNARSERVCMSARDWDKSSEESRLEWKEMQGSKGFTNGN